MSIDPQFERSILAELLRREQRANRLAASAQRPRALAEKVHRGRHDVLAHLRRVAYSVPRPCRSIAWLHHAYEAGVTSRALSAAGLTRDDMRAIELLSRAGLCLADDGAFTRARVIAAAPDPVAGLARAVARAALEDRLDGEHVAGETRAALRLLADPLPGR